VGRLRERSRVNAVLSRRYALSALHSLANPSLSDEENERIFGACFRLHGHDYQVEVSVSGPVDPHSGMVLPRDEFDRVVRNRLIEPLTATLLNDHFDSTTGESLCVEFFSRLQNEFPPPVRLVRLVVQETAKNRFIRREGS
jgi:6-pyruvoyltetrahydropterin/6-carboxytetrahydropterin synthase